MDKKVYNIIITLMMIFAIIIRIANWPNIINDINCDEAMTAINARAIAETGQDIYGTSYPVYFEAWVYGGQSAFAVYLIALFIKIFGFSIFAIRLPILIMSILGIIFCFLLANKIFTNKKISIIVLAMLAINPWSIMQSSWTLDCNFFPHILVIALYFLLLGNEKGKILYLYIAMIFFSLSLYTYGVALYLIPILLVFSIIFLLKNKDITIVNLMICAIIVIILSLPILLMTIINLFDLSTIKLGNITIQNFEYVIRTNDMLIFSKNIFNTLFQNINFLGEVTILQNDGLVWNSLKNFGTIYLISLPTVIIGIVVLFNNKNIYNNFGSFILKIWLGISIFCGIMINNVNINRINVVWYLFIILNSLGIYKIIESVNFKKKYTIIFLILYFINFLGFINYYHTVGRNSIINSHTWSKGLIPAIEYVNTMDNNEIIISRNVANTDKEDIFIRYATKGKQEKIKNDEFIKTYIMKEQDNMNFSTNKKKYSIVNLYNGINLNDEIYVIEKEEYNIIQNKEEYNKLTYNNYIVLTKNKE